MSRKKLFLASAFGFVVLLIALFGVAAFATPALFRIWVNQTTRGEKLDIHWSSIEAPIFRALVVHDVTVRSKPGAPVAVAIDIPRATLAFRLAALWDKSRGRALRRLTVENVRADFRQTDASTPLAHPKWPDFQRLIADNLSVTLADLRVVRGDNSLALRDAVLTASELEAGRFSAREISVVTPWFAKTFRELKGATSWEYNRLTLGAVSLLPGLDIDAIRFDVAHLSEDRIGIEANLDVFGGKLRASIATTAAAWDVAGTATQVSLAQISDSLGFADRASGAIRSSKFTFRGDPANFADATVSFWAEANGFTWRDRTADTLMLGASLSNRQIQIDQLYVKQHDNQLTLNGESPLPTDGGEWPDFRGDISASIKDLGAFARLFGGRAADFSGEIQVTGSVTEREHKLGGQLTSSGHALVFFGAPVDTLQGKFAINGSSIEIQKCELRHAQDFATATGAIELGKRRNLVGQAFLKIADLASYETLLRWAGGQLHPEGRLNAEAELNASKTTFRFHGRKLRLAHYDTLLPFDAEVEGTSSAGDTFFPRVSLTTERASFQTSATVAQDYVHLQELRFDLNGRPVLSGEVFLPLFVPFNPFKESLFTGIFPDSVYNVDLQLTNVDLAELAAAVTTRHDLAGKLEGRVQIFGTSEKPEGNLTIRGRDLVITKQPLGSVSVDSSVVSNLLTVKATAAPPAGAPSTFAISLPFSYKPDGHEYWITPDDPVAGALDLANLNLGTLRDLSLTQTDIRGTVRTHLGLSGSWQHPSINGSADLDHVGTPDVSAVNAHVDFTGSAASISSGSMSANPKPTTFTGDATFADSYHQTTLRLSFDHPLFVDLPQKEISCVQSLQVSNEPAAANAREARELSLDFTFFVSKQLKSFFQLRNFSVDDLALPFCSGDADRAEVITVHTVR